MRVREAWVRATEQLAHRGIVDASIEAEVLLRHALDMDRAQFFATLAGDLSPSNEAIVTEMIQRRVQGEPLAYITGRREFYGLDLFVNASVLIPRQETELLVDKVLEFSSERRDHPLVIADLGTGSGAIAVAIARHLALATIYATDSSHEALVVADINRRKHAVEDRVHLLHGDLFDALPAPVDLIVSNLPYLRSDEMAALSPELRREPSQALHGGTDGLDTIARLLRQAPSHMRPGGQLLVEIAPGQLRSVLQLGRDAFPKAHISYARDLLGLARVVSVGLAMGRERQRAHAWANNLTA